MTITTPQQPIVIIHGEDTYQQTDAVSKLRAAWIPEGMDDLAHQRLVNPDIASVVDAIQQVSLGLISQQMIEVAGFAPLSRAVKDSDKHWLEQLKEALENLPPTKRVAFIDGKFSKTVTFGKWLAKQANVEIIACKPLNFWQTDEAALQLVQTAKASSITIEPAAAHALVENYGVSLQPLMREAEKLAVYAMNTSGDSGALTPRPVTVSDVVELSAHNNDVFKLLDEWLAEQSPAKRFIVADEILLRENPIRLMALMQSRLEMAFNIKYFQRHRLDSDAMAARLKVKSGRIYNELKKLNHISYDRIKHLRQQCLQAEWDAKRGDLNARLAIEQLLAQ